MSAVVSASTLAGDVHDVGEDGRTAAGDAADGDARPLAVADVAGAGPDAVAVDEVSVVTGAKAIHHRVDEGEVRLVDQLEAVDVAAEDLRGGPAEHALGGAGPHAERAILVGLDERDGQGIEVLEHQAALLNRGARTGAGQVTIPGHDARWS